MVRPAIFHQKVDGLPPAMLKYKNENDLLKIKERRYFYRHV